ncbi:hypothetical protein [Rufibacter psychrotolerans]|uniref:hypothetical protein n=1 Tax=Rufibacter psychrotolerans TaxID=2812556 RepID=UPI001966F1CF|nr:hypothetical protein [Rufibacter sp. SYSU D00308]
MRKLLHLLWLLTAPYLMASCSDDEEPAPAPYSALTSTVIFSKYTNNGYLPVGRTNEMKVYSGDTLRYFFRFESTRGVKDLKVYDNFRGRDWPLIIGHKSSSVANGITTREFELQYIVDSYALKVQPGQEVVLTVEPEEADGTIYKDPATGKPLEIKFTLAAPYEYSGVKLYNYFGYSRNSISILDYRIGDFQPQTLIDEQGLLPYAFLTNKMPPREWFDTRFEHSFTSGPAMGSGQVSFVKVPSGGKNWHQPNQIALAMKQYGPGLTTVENVQVGDVYAFKIRYPFEPSWLVYGLMEVTNVVDDGGDTHTGNGDDNDYMEFDIKYYPGYRY